MALTVSPGDPTIPLGPSKPDPPWTNSKIKVEIKIHKYLARRPEGGEFNNWNEVIQEF